MRSSPSTLRFLALTALALCLMAAGCFQKTSEQFVEAGKHQLDRGESAAAVIEFKNALAKNADNGNARRLLGITYNNMGLAENAEKELRTALKLGVIEGGSTQAELGRSLVMQGKYKEVLDEIKSSPAYTNPASAAILAVNGDAYLGLNQVPQAISAYEEALKIEPDFPDALVGQARLRLSQNDLAGAVEQLNAALKKSPRDLRAWLLKGDVLRGQSNYDQAIAAYSQALTLSPNHIPVYLSRAAALITLNKLDEAQRDVNAVSKIARNIPINLYLQALINFRKSKYRDAQALIIESLKLRPGYPPAILLSGAVHYALGAFSQAEQALTLYVRVYPNDLYARKLLVATLLELNQGGRALEVVTPALGKELEDGTLLSLAGTAYMRVHDYTKASDLIERAAKADPNNASLRTNFAISRYAAGDRDRAAVELEAAGKMDPSQFRSDFTLVLTLLNNRNFSDALAAAQKLVQKQPENPISYNLVGAAYHGAKDLANARKNFELALAKDAGFFAAAANLATLDLEERNPAAARKRLESVLAKDPRNMNAMLALASVAAGTGNAKDSAAWLEKAIAANPAAVAPRIQLAAYYLRAGEPKKALEVAQQGERIAPQDGDTLDVLGLAQLANANTHGALATFSKAAQLRPNSTLAHYRVASVQGSLGDGRAAVAELNKALAINPNMLEALVSLGKIRIREGRAEDAIKLARRIQQRYPKLADGFELEGDALLAQGKFKQAVKVFEAVTEQRSSVAIKTYMALTRAGNADAGDALLQRWVKEHPDDEPARMYLADAYIQTNRASMAAAEYEAVLQKAPNNMLALVNLAWSYLAQRDPRALEVAERAYKLMPDSGGAGDVLGWILLEQGNTARALELLQKAVAGSLDNLDYQYHLAVALAKSGDKAKARQKLDDILAKGQKFRLMTQAKELRSQL